MLLKEITSYYPYYIFFLAVFLLIIASIEFIFPEKVFSFWMKWISSRLFRIQGAFYIVGGFPLTQMRNSIAGYIMFFMGLFVVLMGPFILFYPEKFLSLINAEKEMLNNDKKRLIYSDAVMKIILSFILFINTYKTIIRLS